MDKITNKEQPFYIYALLAAITFLVYAQVLRHDFLYFDDNLYVSANPNVKAGLSGQSINWAFTTSYAANWHPVTWLSHLLDCQLFGLNPSCHHLVNVLFHTANTLLLFALLNAMTGAVWRSAFVAAAFALHPLHIESAAWIAERKDLLSAFFGFLAILGYLQFVKKKSVKWYAVTLLLFALGLMSKPMLVTLPFVLLLLDYWPLERFTGIRTNWKNFVRLVVEKIPFFVMGVISSIVTFIVQRSGGAMATIDKLPLENRLINAVLSYGRYISKMFWPTKLAILYPMPKGAIPIWEAIVYALILIALTILIFRLSSKYKYLLMGWLWYLVTLVPVIGLVQVGSQAMADRYTYIPLIGLFIIVSFGTYDVLKNSSQQKIIIQVLSITALTVMSIVTTFQLSLWRDSISLFEHTLAVTKNNGIIYANIGACYVDTEQPEKAVDVCIKALQIRKSDSEAYCNLAAAYNKLERYEEAVQACKEAIKIKANDAKPYCNLGVSYAKLGKYKESIETFQKALLFNPDEARAYYYIGFANRNLGNYKGAIAACQKAIQLNPSDIRPYCDLGISYGEVANYTEAINTFSKALQILPNDAETYYNLGHIYQKTNRDQEAINAFEKAIRFDPNFAKAYCNLGVAYAKRGNYQKTVEVCEKAVKIDPNYAEAHFNLGISYLVAGKKDSAMEQYNILKKLNSDWADKLMNIINK